MVNTKVTLSGWTLDNPVIPASGTFGFGAEFKDFYDINLLGTFFLQGNDLGCTLWQPYTTNCRM